MCTGSKSATTSTVAVSDPIVTNTQSTGMTASAAKSNNKKQRGRAGNEANMLSTDKTILGGGQDAAAVRTTLG